MRCRHQKRRCDRAIPECGLCFRYIHRNPVSVWFTNRLLKCFRLHQACRYEVLEVSSGAAPSPSSRTDRLFGLEELGPNNVKNAIIERLAPIAPGDVASEYTKSVHPWFPIVSHAFQRQFPSSWNEASIDFTILALWITMLTSTPPSVLQDENKSLYVYAKSWTSLVEGFGINSIEVVQARTFMALFEAAHGLYPAASISIGAASRAADALNVNSVSHMTSFRYSNGAAKTEETTFLWFGIHILDR